MECKSRNLEVVRPNLYNKKDLMPFAFRVALLRLASNALQISPVRILYERLLNRDTVIVSLYDQYRRFLMIKQSYSEFWTLPGGILKRGEEPKDGAVRELKEETGLEIAKENLSYVGYLPQNRYGARMHIFSSHFDSSSVSRIIIKTAEIEQAALICVQDLGLYTIDPYAKDVLSMVKFTN